MRTHVRQQIVADVILLDFYCFNQQHLFIYQGPYSKFKQHSPLLSGCLAATALIADAQAAIRMIAGNTSVTLQSAPLGLQDIWTNVEFSNDSPGRKLMRAISGAKGQLYCSLEGAQS